MTDLRHPGARPSRRGIWGAPIRPAPAAVEASRAAYRAERRPRPLVGWRHFAAIIAAGAGAAALSAAMRRAPSRGEWACLPAAFLFANFIEWLAHRYPMHHPMKPLTVAYEMHAQMHHRLFTEASMEAESAADFDMVLFSPPSLAFFMLGIAAPVAALCFAFVSWNAGWLFVALAVDYYVLYECFHLAYHLPEESWLGRLPGMSRLRRHHTHHHDLRLMTDWNFNVTFPIFDRLFGTHWERARRSGRG
jgi:sterol desaturase/sphingolipid hydroxylase (fatty acid hydroxylase superfamily)